MVYQKSKCTKKSSELIKNGGKFILEIHMSKNKVINLIKKGFYTIIKKDLAIKDRC